MKDRIRFLDALIRLLKGVYVSFGFALYGVSMLTAFILVVPPVTAANYCLGPSFNRMQRLNRIVFSFFLAYLRLGRVVSEMPSIGTPIPGPCLVVANHPGFFDVLFLLRDLPATSVLVKPSLFGLMGPILKASGYIRASGRGGSFPSTRPQREALGLLGAGYRFLVFPEGTRSPDGEVLPFSAWAADLAQKAGVTIQPVAIKSHPPLLSREQRWYYPPREPSVVKIEFLEPVDCKGNRRIAMDEVRSRIVDALERGPAGTSGLDAKGYAK